MKNKGYVVLLIGASVIAGALLLTLTEIRAACASAKDNGDKNVGPIGSCNLPVGGTCVGVCNRQVWAVSSEGCDSSNVFEACKTLNEEIPFDSYIGNCAGAACDCGPVSWSTTGTIMGFRVRFDRGQPHCLEPEPDPKVE